MRNPVPPETLRVWRADVMPFGAHRVAPFGREARLLDPHKALDYQQSLATFTRILCEATNPPRLLQNSVARSVQRLLVAIVSSNDPKPPVSISSQVLGFRLS